ncbi:sulfite exporter TauE/SafE family protein 4 isoform X3 [Magnolia sinica]|uniref:sulfite exporter TauE/SafE family protein 4 isoform X3 n=1 Tax=Magnolia sinica TaxID=86752 RepID=UPI00265A47A7|nr:sulfite exporter TauE/SafE family protein 4 isoform X3 [Magnolia sinica]
MESKGFLLCLLSSFMVAILPLIFLSNSNSKLPTHRSLLSSRNSTLSLPHPLQSIPSVTSSVRVWPDLVFNWRSVLATIIGFLGSAFGTVGGVGGGGIFVPMLNLIVGFDTKSAAALSKCTSSRSFFKGIEMWKEETVMKMEIEKREAQSNANSQVIIDAGYEPLIPKEEKSGLEILLFNIRWKRTLVLVVVWVAFLLLQIFKNNTAVCSPLYWVLNILQFPVSLSVFGYGALKLYRESKKRRMCGNTETVCEATISWTGFQLLFCALCGILGGTVGGLLGSGGGFILGPLLLEIGVIPQVASATATFVMMFSSSLSVVEFYFLKRFPIPYALYLIAVSVLAGFWGQCLIRKLVTWLRRASIIVFILSAVIFASALTMGVVGVGTSLSMIHKHEYMGFLSFCEE